MSQVIYDELPGSITGYEIFKNCFEAVIPEEGENLFTTPSAEAEAAWAGSAVNSTLAQVSTYQKFGILSERITPTNTNSAGVYFTNYIYSADVHTFSVYLKGAKGDKYEIYIASSVGTRLCQSTIFTGKGFWERVAVTCYLPTAAANYRFYVLRITGGTTRAFYVDGIQVEKKAYATTYIDGDLEGATGNLKDYFWKGKRRESVSVRRETTRSGGRLVNLTELGLTITSVSGLGMPSVTNAMTQFLEDGAMFSGARLNQRDFTIAGVINAETLRAAQLKFSALVAVLNPDNGGQRQELRLHYTPRDDYGEQIGETVEIICNYRDGLMGEVTNNNLLPVSITFEKADPYIYQIGNSATEISGGYSPGSLNGIGYVNENGVFSIMGTGISTPVTGQIFKILTVPSGEVFAFGDFTNMAGVANTNGAARWSPVDGLWRALAGGLPAGAIVYDAVYDDFPATNPGIIIVGNFLNPAGLADSDYIVKYETGTDSLVLIDAAYGAADTLNGIAYACDIVLYKGRRLLMVGGDFTNASGVASADYIAYWDYSDFTPTGDLWKSLGGSPIDNAGVRKITHFNEVVYVGGSFTSVAGDVTMRYLVRHNLGIVGFAKMGEIPSMVGGYVNKMTMRPDGTLFFGGNFINAGNVTSADYIAQYNGVSYQAVLDGLSYPVLALATDTAGQVYFSVDVPVGGTDRIGNETLVNYRYYIYNGAYIMRGFEDTGEWDAAVPPGRIQAIHFGSNECMYLGWQRQNSGNAAYGPYAKTVTNSGTGLAHVWFDLSDLGSIMDIINRTTGQVIQVNTDFIQLAQTLNAINVIDCRPGKARYWDAFYGDRLRQINVGSRFDFRLAPGSNKIMFKVFPKEVGNVIYMLWKNAYQGIENVVE